MSEARRSVERWLQRRGGTIRDFVFPSRVDYMDHLSTRQHARLVDGWVETIGLDQREYGTHSMLRTKASLIYKSTGNLRAVQILLGHSNIENTVRYLGVDIDDALTLSERTDIYITAGLGRPWGCRSSFRFESCLSANDNFSIGHKVKAFAKTFRSFNMHLGLLAGSPTFHWKRTFVHLLRLSHE